MQARRDGYRLVALGCILEFLGIVIEEKPFNEESDTAAMQGAHSISRFGNVFSLIRNKCGTPITLEDATHYTPIEYLTHYRIEYSKYLLCAKDCTVQEATFAAGFASAAYYIKMFKSATGVTPGRYKKDCLFSESDTKPQI